jgi:hypothetical protein
LPALDLEIDLLDDGSFSNRLLDLVGKTWRSILQDYTNQELTKETNKLAAISAIAEALAPHFGCDYLARLWRRNLVYDLMWTADELGFTMLKVSNSGSPSWS